jgi:hypothetical protein
MEIASLKNIVQPVLESSPVHCSTGFSNCASHFRRSPSFVQHSPYQHQPMNMAHLINENYEPDLLPWGRQLARTSHQPRQ